jgi:hypothetical protein
MSLAALFPARYRKRMQFVIQALNFTISWGTRLAGRAGLPAGTVPPGGHAGSLSNATVPGGKLTQGCRRQS